MSSIRLHQRLIIYKRYYIALNRAPYTSEHDTQINKISCTEHETNYRKANSTSKVDPTVGLARVGSRAALNFSFAFLRRAWRLGIYYKFENFNIKAKLLVKFLGEDIDLCSELLTEALEALQMLPVATLYEESNVSPIWLEVVERSTKFLKQVVTGYLLIFFFTIVNFVSINYNCNPCNFIGQCVFICYKRIVLIFNKYHLGM